MTFEEFQALVIAEAKAAGLTEYELYYAEEESLDTSAMQGKITGFANDKTAGCSFRCIVDGKAGSCSTELFTDSEASRIVREAMDNAAYLNKEAAPIFGGSSAYPEVQNPAPEKADMRAMALDLYHKTLAEDPRVQESSENTIAEVKGSVRIINSAGLDLSNTYAFQLAMQSAILREGDEMYDGDEYEVAPLASVHLEKIAKVAVENAKDTIGAEPVASGKYPVVFTGRAFASLLGANAQIFSAKAAQNGLSLLAGKEGEQIASPLVTIIDDPLYAESGAKMPFDAEGVATRTKKIVDSGVFTTLLYNLETAGKAGVESTGNASKASYYGAVGIAPFTFYLAAGDTEKEALYQMADGGLIITSLAGLHAGLNPITGDLSLMASGFRIENGKKGKPVNGITVSGNFFRMLESIKALGNDLEFGFPRGFTRIGSPSVLVPELSVAGK